MRRSSTCPDVDDGRPRQTRAASQSERQTTLAWVRSVPIDLPPRTEDALVREACDHFNDHNPHTKFPADPGRSSAEFLERIQFNYVRHHFTAWDRVYAAVVNGLLQGEARVLMLKRITAAVRTAYPWLVAECRRRIKQNEQVARGDRKFFTRN